MLGYLNINSVRNKFDNLFSIIGNKFDVFAIAESKLDSSFPDAQFKTRGYKMPYRLDISDKSGGILVYVKTGLPSMLLNRFSLPKDIQIVPVELRLANSKWLIVSIYRPPKQNFKYFLDILSDMLDFYSYEKSVLIGDFNAEPDHFALKSFLNAQVLHNHVNFKTCWKSKEGRCIDLILSNQKFSLQHTGNIDTGLSDHHQLIHTMLKSTYIRQPPKNIVYRDYSNFDREVFQQDLEKSFNDNLNLNVDSSYYEIFEVIFEMVLNRHAPQKNKMIRGNEKPHMDKALKKAIMKRSQLKNVYKRSKCSSDWNAYKKQRNLVTNLNKKARISYFSSAVKSCSVEPKVFWKICKPFMSKQSISEVKIILATDEKVIQDDEKISNCFNEYFNGITNVLNLFKWNPSYCSDIENPVLRAIDKFKGHPSIIKIKSELRSSLSPRFHFEEVSTITVQKLIMSLDDSKKTSGSISTKSLKLAVNVVSSPIKDCINTAFRNCKFPSKLKLTEISPIPKAGSSQEIGNFRPISILPTVSKLFEKVIAQQIGEFFKPLFSIMLCGFRKKHSTQHALFRLLHLWQNNLDKGKVVGTILMDLSKAYDCLPHDLIIAKLEAYGLDFASLSLLRDYLSNRHHRVKVGSSLSAWLELFIGVPQGSILGPLLFNIFLNDLFFFIEEAGICNFADDNTLFACANEISTVISILEKETCNVLEWFKVNSLAANPAKFQIMFLGVSDKETREVCVEGVYLKATTSVKLLGVVIDSKLSFKQHVETLCKTASQKVKALFRIRPYLNVECAKRLCNAFIMSNFNYCPLIWMAGLKSNNELINKVHKRAMRAVYGKFQLSFQELLELGNSETIHVRNLKTLLIEVFKSLNRLNPEFMWHLFTYKSVKYTLRSGQVLSLPPTKTTKFGLNSLVFRGSLLWNTLPPTFKVATTLHGFKMNLKAWNGENCSCPVCS